MPNITLNFSEEVQQSVQINDVVYYVPVSSLGGFDTQNSDIVILGPVISVSVNTVVYNNDVSGNTPTPYSSTNPTNHLIMFSKDNVANMSSLLGYYSKFQFTNDSTSEGELFNVESEIFESSK
tara:strand:- start:442 stop:810 length:369 start_codon:yes stop_codon:yes gene_type:complete